ncbi:MAG: glycoside hydrolase domain-containing protein [Vulcanimicrobiaceae bacterium]
MRAGLAPGVRLLIAIGVALALAAACVGFVHSAPGQPAGYFAWFGLLAVLLLWLVSSVLAGDLNPLAPAMGFDNRLSTSKFQILLWTACVGFVYATVYAYRLIGYNLTAPISHVPENVLFALGISVTTAVGAKAITSSQVTTDPMSKQPVDTPSYDPTALVRDDDASTANITKVQILFWTGIAIIVYLTTMFNSLHDLATCGTGCSFPDIDATLMLFMGLGHATYLGAKLVPTANQATKATTPSALLTQFRAPALDFVLPEVSELLWGVDTSNPINDASIARATQQIQKPAFWGRYLTGFRISSAEIALLASHQIRLLPIYQGTTTHPSLLSGGISGQQGVKDAADAIRLARDVHGIPAGRGVALYADIEPEYVVSRYWLTAWIQELTGAGYLAGIYCGSNQPGIMAGMGGIGYIDPANVVIWSCMPHDTTKTGKADVPTVLQPPGFTVGTTTFPVEMWQYCLDFGDFDFNVCTRRAYDAMWQP